MAASLATLLSVPSQDSELSIKSDVTSLLLSLQGWEASALLGSEALQR